MTIISFKFFFLKIFLTFAITSLFSQPDYYCGEIVFRDIHFSPVYSHFSTGTNIENSYSVDSNPLKTIYEYDACGNRIARKVIEINTVGNSSASQGNGAKMLGSDYADPSYYVENIGEISVNVFPNPTSQKITIKINNYEDLQNGELYLYNVNGQLLNQFIIRNTSVEIDLSGMPSGTYLLKLYMNDYKNEWKIIKN